MNKDSFKKFLKSLIIYLGTLALSWFLVAIPAVWMASVILNWNKYLSSLFTLILIFEFVGVGKIISTTFKE